MSVKDDPISTRIGLFGGTFNPIHHGHLQVALEVRRRFPLDEVFLVPSLLPPHKSRQGMAAAADRHRMIQLAVGRRSALHVSDLELRRPGPSYTIDTVHHLRALLPADSRLYLMVGLDAFLEIATWRRYRELLKEVPVIVMSRPSEEAPAQAPPWKKLEDYLQSSISKAYRFDPRPSCFTHPQWQPIHPFEVTPVPISSTRIRDRIRREKPIGTMVPQAVADYIERKGLYR